MDTGRMDTDRMDSYRERQGGSPKGHPRWLATLLGATVLVVVGGGVGGSIVLALDGGSGTSHAASARAGTASPGSAPVRGVSANQLNVSAIANKVDPGVVDITSNLGGAGGQRGVAAGTGMVLTSSGEVLTNNHVIAGASSITAQVAGQSRRYTATVVGADPTADVAVLKLTGASGLNTVRFGNATNVSVGDQVVAIGNALDLRGAPTVTQGIVSALNRSITAGDSTGGSSEQLTGMIQTDAPLNPGNSGGPLVNSAAQVIGMDTAADVAASGGSGSSIGFAIPINRAYAIAQQIEAGHGDTNILIGPRPLLGVEVTSISAFNNAGRGGGYRSGGGSFGGGGSLGGGGGPSFGGGGTSIAPVSSGAVVLGVEPSSPAQSAGLATGDVVVSLGGKSVSSPSSLTKVIETHHPGDQVSVSWVDPSGAHHSANATLTTGPAA